MGTKQRKMAEARQGYAVTVSKHYVLGENVRTEWEQEWLEPAAVVAGRFTDYRWTDMRGYYRGEKPLADGLVALILVNEPIA